MQILDAEPISARLTSFIHRYGVVRIDGPGGKRYWFCSLCPKHKVTRYATGSTVRPIDHLWMVHRINKNGSIKPPPVQNSPYYGCFVRHNALPALTYDPAVFRQLLMMWIVKSRVSFRQVQTLEFRYMLSCLAAAATPSKALPKLISLARPYSREFSRIT